MAIRIKKKESDNSKDKIVTYGIEDMVAVELLGDFGKGKVVAMHKIAADKLVKAKTGKIVDVKLEEVKDSTRVTMEVDGKKHGKAHKDS